MLKVISTSWFRNGETGPRAHHLPRCEAAIFDGDRLIDASPSARYLTGHPDQARRRLEGRLLAIFPDMAALPADPAEGDEHRMRADPLWLAVSVTGGLTRFELGHSDGRTDPALYLLARLLEMGEKTFDALPVPIWRQCADGRIGWANRAFRHVFRDGSQPPEGLLAPAETSSASRLFRRMKPGNAAQPILTAPHGTGSFAIALDPSPEPGGQSTSQDVVQALSTTFASLSAGLAVFGRDRRLALFNPALSDLTTLPAATLAARPTIFDFFDALRAARMTPEARDFVSWRDHVLDLERACADGTFRDTWHLASGQVMRVAGRPQREGALTLLFEDITGEIGLTRSMRAQIDTAQAVLDNLDSGLGVFAPDGTLVLANQGLDRLWGRDTMATPEPLCLADLARDLDHRLDGEGGRALIAALRRPEKRREHSGLIRLDGSLEIKAETRQLGGGMTLVRLSPFRGTPRAEAVQQPPICAEAP